MPGPLSGRRQAARGPTEEGIRPARSGSVAGGRARTPFADPALPQFARSRPGPPAPEGTDRRPGGGAQADALGSNPGAAVSLRFAQAQASPRGEPEYPAGFLPGPLFATRHSNFEVSNELRLD